MGDHQLNEFVVATSETKGVLLRRPAVIVAYEYDAMTSVKKTGAYPTVPYVSADRSLIAFVKPSSSLADGGEEGGAARGADYIIIEMPRKENHEAAEDSDSADKLAKIMLPTFCGSLAASCAAYPIVKQAVPGGYAYLFYSLLVGLALVLLFGILVTTFDKSPKSVVVGKYALQLAIGIIIALLTWAMSSLNPEPRYDVPISVAGALICIVVAALFQWRKW